MLGSKDVFFTFADNFHVKNFFGEEITFKCTDKNSDSTQRKYEETVGYVSLISVHFHASLSTFYVKVPR